MGETMLEGKLYFPLLKTVPSDNIKIGQPQKPEEAAKIDDEQEVIAKVGFKKPTSWEPCSSKEGCYNYAWKNGDPQVVYIQGKEILFIDAEAYHEEGKGGDLHGVVGGVTQAFDWQVENRPDISESTHFIFYAYIESGSAYLSIEFFDYDPDIKGAKNGFASNFNLGIENGGKPGISEKELLERSNGEVNMEEYKKHRYDGYRWRIFGSDGWKAQKLLISGKKQLYRIEVSITKKFVEKYFINTGFGDNKMNIKKGEFERMQFVFYVTEKPGEPLIPYKRGMVLLEYQKDPTSYGGKSEGYRCHQTVKIGIGTEATFIKAPKRTNLITITPITKAD